MKASARDGFTLLEVLIAMTVFFTAVAFFSIAYLNTLSAINSVQVNQGLEQDLEVVRQKALLLADLDEFEEGGEVLTGEHGLARWRSEVEPTELADLFYVTLSIELDPENEEEPSSAEQSFYLLRPTWSDPTERETLRERTRERLADRQSGLSR